MPENLVAGDCRVAVAAVVVPVPFHSFSLTRCILGNWTDDLLHKSSISVELLLVSYMCPLDDYERILHTPMACCSKSSYVLAPDNDSIGASSPVDLLSVVQS